MAEVHPDPTIDLNWSAFRGAIHDIFASNAKKFPDRTCVVETATTKSPRRTFNYQQIFEASCQLSHKLVSSGITRGDVVMIFAYRGVDLVISIMGTLMAGATFSVLDPLYPPERQAIYLDVARPRALICIEKATEEAGQLSDTVRNFIDTELELKTEIPALRLLDDGTLIGGQVDGTDCLEAHASSKADLPGVVVGPDSIPTLSFTSGSEGKPKGVQGRHYSLTYYFDWMAERFGLSDQDRFTMLSGMFTITLLPYSCEEKEGKILICNPQVLHTIRSSVTSSLLCSSAPASWFRQRKTLSTESSPPG